MARPSRATRRPKARAAPMICWMRWMLEAKQATKTRPRAPSKTSSSAGPTCDSESEVPSRSALVESERRSRTPSRPSASIRARSMRGPGHRGGVDLEVAGVEQEPLRRAEREAAGVRDGVGDREELGRDGRGLAGRADVARRHLAQVGLHPRLLEARPEQREREAARVDGDRDLAQEEGERAEVILVTVGEEDRAHLLAPLAEPAEVWRDQVHAEGLVREEDAAVHHGDAAVRLDRHAVHADLAQAPEGHDAHGRRHGPESTSERAPTQRRRAAALGVAAPREEWPACAAGEERPGACSRRGAAGHTSLRELCLGRCWRPAAVPRPVG